MKIHVLTLFPEMVNGPIQQSMLNIAQEKNIVSIEVIDIRGFAVDKHRSCDDRPYGGGPGMIMMPEPILGAIEHVRTEKSKVIFLTPQGQVFKQKQAQMLSQEEHLIFLCGHYEGVDERVRSQLIDMEISLGDYVITNGAIASLVVIDACVRLIPGVLGSEDSLQQESFSNCLLEYPQYTRPRQFNGEKVPEVLVTGDHTRISNWRLEKSLMRTKDRRPDLIQEYKKLKEDDGKVV